MINDNVGNRRKPLNIKCNYNFFSSFPGSYWTSHSTMNIAHLSIYRFSSSFFLFPYSVLFFILYYPVINIKQYLCGENLFYRGWVGGPRRVEPPRHSFQRCRLSSLGFLGPSPTSPSSNKSLEPRFSLTFILTLTLTVFKEPQRQ